MTSCKQCGTCCQKGGPALHLEDLDLLQKKLLPISCLVTIRKGEPVFSPISGVVEPAKQELLKVSASNSWTCPFLNQTSNQCEIYKNRPVECRLLKCWDSAKLENIIYKDNISRWDIIKPDSEIFNILKQHGIKCSFADIEQLSKSGKSAPDIQAGVDEIIKKDLSIREQAINQFGLSLEKELFYFGRPMFKSLDYYFGKG